MARSPAFVARVVTVSPSVAERVVDLELERERVPRRRVERQPERDAIGRALERVPVAPAHEAVDRVGRARAPRAAAGGVSPSHS